MPIVGSSSLLRHRDFQRLWAAATVSQLGTRISELALPLVAILALSANAFQIGLIDAAAAVPFLLVGLPAGAWIDRLRRRPVMIVSDLARGLCLLSIPVAYVAGLLSIGLLLAVSFIVGTFVLFFNVAYQAYLPSLVGEARLVDGSSKLEISASGAAITGPTIAGGLVAAIGAPFAVLFDSISYFVSGLLIWSIRQAEPAPQTAAPAARRSLRAEIIEGVRYVLVDTRLRAIAASVALTNLWLAVIFAVLLLYLVRDLGLNAATIGLAFGVGNIGWLVGASLGERIPRRFGVGSTIVGSAALFGVPMLAIAFAPHGTEVAVLIGGWALFGLVVVVNNVNQVSYRQAITPPGMRGRMNASMQFINQGTIPIGAILGGILGTTVGLHTTLVIGAVGLVFAFVPLVASPVRSAAIPADSPV